MSTVPQHKAFRYRLRPTPEQESVFRQWAGARRWTFNHFLARRIEHYKLTGKTLSYNHMAGELTVLKRQPETAWLREVDSQLLQQAVRDLDKAFASFFARRSRFPRFKAKKRETPTFRIPQRVRVQGHRLVVPKVGPVRLVLHRPLTGTVKSATFKQDATGAWYVTLVVHFELPDRPLPPPDPELVVGLDLGLHDLAVTSNGERVPAPKHYRRAERKLRRLQRHFARCQRGSKGREQARRAVARQHLRVANQRKDFLHKLSAALVDQYQAVCIEDLTVSGLGRTNLSKSVHDAGWAQLRLLLTYKARWAGKHLVVVGRFFPSSRLCPLCGVINSDLTLADRVWTCGCGAVHDRDVNAARNIRTEGLRLLACAEGYPEQSNALRELVRPATRGHGSLTREAPPF
jgi:putative transposase